MELLLYISILGLFVATGALQFKLRTEMLCASKDTTPICFFSRAGKRKVENCKESSISVVKATYIKRIKFGKCPLCRRTTDLTFHHLIPRKMHRRTFFRKHYTKDELEVGIDICRQCHKGIHRNYDEMTLAKQFNSLEKLQADDTLSSFFSWVAKQKIASR